MGFTADIYDASKYANCSNGGISSRCNTVTIVEIDGKPVRGPFEPNENAPAVRIVRRWAGTPREYLHAEPVDRPEGKLGPMAGGAFIYSCDSRFRDLNAYPIPLHDRFETQEQYDSNWR